MYSLIIIIYQVHRDELPTTSKQTKARLSLQLSRGSKRPKSSASLPLSST